MAVLALGISRGEKPWYSKVLRVMDRDLRDTFRGRVIRYVAEFREAELEVRQAPDFNDAKVLEVRFDVRGWEDVRDAVPKARAQILSGLAALADALGLPQEELGLLGAGSLSAHVLPRIQPAPRAAEHPEASRLLRGLDLDDLYGPFGNDTGLDILDSYAEWRASNPQDARDAFFDRLLKRMACDRDTDDDAMIAAALAQLRIDGGVSAALRAGALEAAARQASGAVLTDRGWDLPQRRRKALDAVRSVLARA
jgi:uncharacterized protein YfeS